MTRSSRTAAPMTAFAHARCEVGHSFGSAFMYPTPADTCGCAECRRRARTHPQSTSRSPRAAAPTTAFAHARCKVGHSFGSAFMYPTTADTCGCAECWRRAWTHPQSTVVIPRRRSDDGIRPRVTQSWSQFRGRVYVPNNCKYTWLRKVSRAARWHSPTRDVKLVSVSGTRPRAQQLQIRAVAQSGGGALARGHIPTQLQTRGATPMVAATLADTAHTHTHTQ